MCNVIKNIALPSPDYDSWERDASLGTNNDIFRAIFPVGSHGELLPPDKVNGGLSRAFVLNALPEQIQKLKILDDPRDLDSILSNIFVNARVQTPDDCYNLYGENARRSRMGFFALLWDVIKDSGILLQIWKQFIAFIVVLGQFLNMSEVRFLVVVAFLTLLGRYYQQKYRFGAITMIIVSVVCFGYFHTYLECNRKLEAERTLEMLSRSGLKPTWYSPIVNFFNSREYETKKSLEEFIKKSSQLNLNFCRPDHVFLLYINDMVLMQLKFIANKFLDIIFAFKDVPAPLCYLGPIMLMIFIVTIMILTADFVLSQLEWMRTEYGRAWTERGQATEQGTHEDRISGEKLRMLFKAMSGKARSKKIKIPNKTATASLTSQSSYLGSDVQEIHTSSEDCSADSPSDSWMSAVTDGEIKKNTTKKTKAQ